MRSQLLVAATVQVYEYIHPSIASQPAMSLCVIAVSHVHADPCNNGHGRHTIAATYLADDAADELEVSQVFWVDARVRVGRVSAVTNNECNHNSPSEHTASRNEEHTPTRFLCRRAASQAK
jgi:hypothetical protein